MPWNEPETGLCCSPVRVVTARGPQSAEIAKFGRFRPVGNETPFDKKYFCEDLRHVLTRYTREAWPTAVAPTVRHACRSRHHLANSRSSSQRWTFGSERIPPTLDSERVITLAEASHDKRAIRPPQVEQ